MGEEGRRGEAGTKGQGGNFCADVGADAVAFAGGVHARGAVEAVAVEEGDGGNFQFHRALDEVSRAAEAPSRKGEGGSGMELDVISHRAPPGASH